MNRGQITKEEYELLKKYASTTIGYALFEELDDNVNIYFSNHEVLVAKLTSDIILNNVKHRDDNELRIKIDEVLNQICERMYYY